ncbi:MAG: hypothetical protein MUQ32_15300, partial [Chloroflexi bacterium]|nr:hypothetical protein [Chloroflexota bacterium]
IVLGIDNVVFISVLVQRLPEDQRDRGRTIGLVLAMGMRILLLLSITWIVGLTQPVVTIADHPVSVRDLILIGGGLFLIWKATTEIHEALEGDEGHTVAGSTASMRSVLITIVLLDIVFSLDSVLTAVGMADDVVIMIAAVVIAVGFMLFASGPISRFVHAHPTVKMLALSFLLLIGITLIADGLETHHRSFDAETRAAMSAAAAHLGLVETGGSDYHGDLGPYAETHALLVMPDPLVANLREALRTRRAPARP